jgi:hypothetical protein
MYRVFLTKIIVQTGMSGMKRKSSTHFLLLSQHATDVRETPRIGTKGTFGFSLYLRQIIYGMKSTILTFLCAISFGKIVISQQLQGSEIGLEGYASASTLGGNFGLALKYGMKINENLIVGPSLRWMKSWSKNNGSNFSYSIAGGGAFAHLRYGNIVFGGAEFELLHSPLYYGFISSSKSWVPTFFVGGGFSREFKEIVRLNAGVFYDMIDNDNSPFRTGYLMKKTNSITGQVSGFIPVIYRISFFFPLGSKTRETAEKEDF